MIFNGFGRAVCANCKGEYNQGDKYCRYCGAPLGDPVFINDGFPVLYGPMPETREHKCEKCGYTWRTTLMLDREKFCPLCGGAAPYTEPPAPPSSGLKRLPYKHRRRSRLRGYVKDKDPAPTPPDEQDPS